MRYRNADSSKTRKGSYKQTNKNLRCGNRKGLLGRNDQTHLQGHPQRCICADYRVTSGVCCLWITCCGRDSSNKWTHVMVEYTNYQLPNGPVKAGRRWGQRHPQGANLGSNGILKVLSKTRTMAATSPP